MEVSKRILFKNKCDIISGCGVVAFVLLALSNELYYGVLGLWIPLFATLCVWSIFLLAALYVWQSGAYVAWLVIYVGNVILTSCSFMWGMKGNVFYLSASIVALLCSLLTLVFGIKDKIKPRRIISIWLAVFIGASLLFGSYWGINVAIVKGKMGEAEIELWTVPTKYDGVESPEKGVVEKISYKTKAYATDLREVTKEAYVYLPYGYDSEKQYKILYLLHGTGDRSDYWLVKNEYNKTMVDNLIYYGDVEPLIIVIPTWYVENDCAEDLDRLTYSFRDELRKDLMPYVEGKYSTYAENTSGEAFIASRDHRAIAGLSRGAVTVCHSALMNGLDYFSRFGVFSGCRTTEEEFATMRTQEYAKYPIHYLYNTTGAFDFMLIDQTIAMERLLQTEPRLNEENYQLDIFPTQYHSVHSWHIALYNCLQLIF